MANIAIKWLILQKAGYHSYFSIAFNNTPILSNLKYQSDAPIKHIPVKKHLFVVQHVLTKLSDS